MPRKTKDSENKEIETKEAKVKKASKATTAKKAETKKKASSTSKVAKTKAATTTKATSTKKATTTKKTTTTKKSTTAKKATPAKKTTTAKKATATKKTATRKKAATKKPEIVEYYDLPYRYDQTIVKILAQTPTNLFIYWDISDKDRENYKKQYGENFFETTRPVLKIYNDTLHYDFEVEINDFANSWYLRINDSKCDYRAELGRRPIEFKSNINSDYIYISSSNEIESPNDKILFNTLDKMVYFRNTKTNVTRSKFIASLSFMKNMGKIYNIYDLYKELYKDEDIENISNPSSGMF